MIALPLSVQHEQAPQPTPLQLAIDNVETAFRELEFTIKLLSDIELGKIDPDDFDSDHSSQLPEGTIQFPKGAFSNQECLERAASISVLMAFAASIMVLDVAFETAGIASSIHSDNDVVKLRTLVSMMRNCVAHAIAAPVWRVNAQFQGNFVIAVGGQQIALNCGTERDTIRYFSDWRLCGLVSRAGCGVGDL